MRARLVAVLALVTTALACAHADDTSAIRRAFSSPPTPPKGPECVPGKPCNCWCPPKGPPIVAVDEASPIILRTVFGSSFNAETVDALEAALHGPLEDTLAPWIQGFEPEPKLVKHVATSLEQRLPQAMSRADEALVSPVAALLGELRVLRAAYDDAKAEGDELAMHGKRAAISRAYSEGFVRLRRIASSAMAPVLLAGNDLEYTEPDLVVVSRKLADRAGIASWEGVADILRAGGRQFAARKLVELVASSTVDAVVARHRPSCAIYITFK